MYSDHQKAICYVPLFQFGRILSTYEHMTNHETEKHSMRRRESQSTMIMRFNHAEF